MRTIFFLSYPFDEPRSGDYDYCTTIVDAINHLNPSGIQAEYLVGETLGIPTDIEINSILLETRKSGGAPFYSALTSYMENPTKKEYTSKIIKYLKEYHSKEKVLNLQMRPPESGFIFSPEELQSLKDAGIKVCITCHEYKLNYDRRWLQTILHPYFEIADKVFFFNTKDLSNAHKHAIRSVFIDDIFSRDAEVESSLLLHSFSSSAHTTLVKQVRGDKLNLYTKELKFQEFSCDMLAGELVCDTKGEHFRYMEGSYKSVRGGSFTLEWGVLKDIGIPKLGKADLKIYGTALGVVHSGQSITDIPSKEFSFNHCAYDLKSKSVLTRVPATAASDIKITSVETRPPNVIIFGLIREGKGFEEALDFIKSAKESLSHTRLIIAGKVVSYVLLAQIIKAKYGIKDLDDKQLKEFDKGVDYNKFIQQVIALKKQKIFSSISADVACTEDMVSVLFKNALDLSNAKSVKCLQAPCNPLGVFINELSQTIPEVLPIDIFLDVELDALGALFVQAKYAIKYDEKGWANNASALINAIYYGCILYTSWGMCTDQEVTAGKYKGAIVLPNGKYGLKDSEHLSVAEEKDGKRASYKTKATLEPKKIYITAQILIDDIKAREELDRQRKEGFSESKAEDIEDDSSLALISTQDNIQTIEQQQKLLREQFDPLVLADEIVKEIDNLFLTDYELALAGKYDHLGFWGIE